MKDCNIFLTNWLITTCFIPTLYTRLCVLLGRIIQAEHPKKPSETCSTSLFAISLYFCRCPGCAVSNIWSNVKTVDMVEGLPTDSAMFIRSAKVGVWKTLNSKEEAKTVCILLRLEIISFIPISFLPGLDLSPPQLTPKVLSFEPKKHTADLFHFNYCWSHYWLLVLGGWGSAENKN